MKNIKKNILVKKTSLICCILTIKTKGYHPEIHARNSNQELREEPQLTTPAFP